jgi:drug/metabolite transporter (DMT)-like permease
METRTGDLPHRRETFPVVLVIVGSILYSAKSLFVKHLMGLGAGSGEILALRMAWALPVYLAVAAWCLRRRKVAIHDMVGMAGLGCVGYWVTTRLNFQGLGSTSACLERILVQSSAAFVVLITALKLRRFPAKFVTFSVLICYGGMVLAALGRDEGRSAADPAGALLIVTAGMFWAIFTVSMVHFQRRLGTALATSTGMAAASVPAIAELALRGDPGILLYPRSDWIPWVAGLVVLSTLGASFATQAGLARTGPVRASLLGLTGPALFPLLSALVLHESMPWQQVAGLSVVLASSAALGLRES